MPKYCLNHSQFSLSISEQYLYCTSIFILILRAVFIFLLHLYWNNKKNVNYFITRIGYRVKPSNFTNAYETSCSTLYSPPFIKRLSFEVKVKPRTCILFHQSPFFMCMAILLTCSLLLWAKLVFQLSCHCSYFLCG